MADKVLKLSTITKLYVLLVFSLGFLNSILPSPIFSILDDLVFLLFILALVSHNKAPPGTSLAFPLIIGAWTFLAFLSESHIGAIILTLRQYKNFFLCFFVFLLNEKTRLFTLKVIKIILAASIPVCIYQFIKHSEWDKITGLLGHGATGILSFLIIFYVSSEITIRKHEKRKIAGPYLLLLIPIALNETKISFIVFPLTIFLGLLLIGKLKALQTAALIALTTLFVVTADYIYQAIYGYTYTEFFTPESLQTYLFNEKDEDNMDLGRFYRVILAYKYLENIGLSAILFGQGVGASFAGENSGLYGVAAYSFLHTTLNQGSRIQLYHSILDFGMIGTFFLLLAILASALVIFKKKNKDRTDIYAFIISIIVFVGFFYQPIFLGREISFVYSLFLFSALRNRASQA